ncbi:hypothetical protein BDZ97DRAFT_1913028 [Flammula alnicola]|nr:hypothetical protein BDZ97DRAFT_1913028 [Flammula alnicola]
MAPRTRSNRSESPARPKLLASGQVFNTRGFPALPDELYLEIVSNFPEIPVPTPYRRVHSKVFHDRHLTLFALSQTCRSLRRVFLRYLWQRIEVYDGMDTGEGPLPPPTINYGRFPTRFNTTNKKHARELVRQLEIVTVRDPSLAEHVNILNVVVVSHSVGTVLPELARCMALFPNLHTVQLCVLLESSYRVRNTFTGYNYPQIRHLCISSEASIILPLVLKCDRLPPT